MKYTEILTALFNDSVSIKEENNVITGHATYAKQEFTLCGVVNEAFLDNQMSQYMAQFILQQIANKPNTNFIVLVDTSGQQVTRHAELIGLNRYFAHLIKTFHWARDKGARVFGIVLGKALGGAFIATALNAEKIYALPSAQIAVMWLEAMAKVTKIPLANLQKLSESSAIFAPGAENFVKLGAVDAILMPQQIMAHIIKDLTIKADLHQWRINGALRGGRTLANQVVNAILNA